MGENAMVQFNMTDVGAKLRERVRAAFMDLIPDEQWDLLIKAEIASFTAVPEPARTGYGYEPAPKRRSGLQAMIYDALEVIAKERIKEAFDGSDWQAIWGNDGNPGPSIVKAAIEMAPKIWDACVVRIMNDVVNGMRSQLNR